MGAADYFSIPIFFIIFRETTEAAIIVSVLLSFLRQVLTDDQVMRKRLARQVLSFLSYQIVTKEQSLAHTPTHTPLKHKRFSHPNLRLLFYKHRFGPVLPLVSWYPLLLERRLLWFGKKSTSRKAKEERRPVFLPSR